MILSELLNAYNHSLLEDTFQDWKREVGNGTAISSVTAKRMLPIGQGIDSAGVYFDGVSGNLIGQAYSAKDYGMWRDRPSYIPKSIPPYSDDGRVMRPMPAGSYGMWLQWSPWRDYVADAIQQRVGEEQGLPDDIPEILIQGIFHEMDMQMHCTCPAFYWQGMRYNLTRDGSAISPTNMSSTVWNGRHDVRRPICKHLIAFIMDIDRNTDYYIEKMYAGIQKSQRAMLGWAFPGSNLP